MPEIFKDIFQDVLSQLFGVAKPRGGRLTFTTHALFKMREHGLSTQTLTDAFRYGQEIESGKIVRVYADYLVGLIYRVTKKRIDCKRQEVRNVVLTCWKGVRRR